MLEMLTHHRCYQLLTNSCTSIIQKVLITQQLGGIINDSGATLNEDHIDVGNRNIKRLSFKITDETGKVMNLYDLNIQFALLLSHPSY